MGTPLQLTNERKAIVTAALFHDIGKFQYRAAKQTRDHAQNSAYFIREHLGRFQALKPIVDLAAKLAEQHHQPVADSRIRDADHLSASERVKEDVEAGRRPLESIFARIDIGVAQPPAGTFCLKPGPIGEENLFPEAVQELNEEDVMAWHREAWEGFLADLKRVPAELDFPGLVWTLHALLEKWCVRVSSAAYRSVPDISLFDHLRVSAAYADCLHLAADEDKPFVVVKGDLGGIQRFIYRLRTPHAEQKGTAKQLRGRSFYVRLVNETLARWVLDELGLLRPSLILSGGGHFLIVAPNREETRLTLRDLRRRANEWLLKNLHLDLALVLEWVSCSRGEVEHFPEVLSKLEAKIGLAKNRRSADLLESHELFSPPEPSKGELHACPVCHALVPEATAAETKCQLCDLHQRIGAAMPSTNYLVEVVAGELADLPTNYGRAFVRFEGMGRAWYLASSERSAGTTELERIVGGLPREALVRITVLGPGGFLGDEMVTLARLDQPHVLGLDFAFQANYLPKTDVGEVKSFEEIAEEGPAFPYLGFFRADVDDLGFVFSRGFRTGGADGEEKDNRSLSRFAALSRELDLFFSHHVDQLAQSNGRQIYITYSGGDDLFVVGHWLHVIDFARSLYQDFNRLTCRNSNLGLSGGIVIARHDYPIRLAAEEAKEAQDEAKDRSGGDGDPGKRALCLFDSVHPWPRVLELVDYAKEMTKLVEEEHPLRAVVRTVLELSRRAKKGDGVDLRAYPALRAYLHYTLARRAGVTSKSLAEGGNRRIEIFGKLISEPGLFEDFEVVGSYVLLATRKRK